MSSVQFFYLFESRLIPNSLIRVPKYNTYILYIGTTVMYGFFPVKSEKIKNLISHNYTHHELRSTDLLQNKITLFYSDILIIFEYA